MKSTDTWNTHIQPKLARKIADTDDTNIEFYDPRQVYEEGPLVEESGDVEYDEWEYLPQPRVKGSNLSRHNSATASSSSSISSMDPVSNPRRFSTAKTTLIPGTAPPFIRILHLASSFCFPYFLFF